MFQSILLAVLLFLGPAAPLEADKAADAAANAPATQPATQPATAVAVPGGSSGFGASASAASAADDSFYGVFRRTRVGELVEGKKRATLDDVKDPIFWIDTVRDLALAIIGFIPRIIVAGRFLVFFWLLYRGLRKVLIGALQTAGVDASIRDMLAHLLKWAVMGFGLVIACNQVGIQIAALLTGVSIIGLAVGFAAKETIENFIAGIVIFWDKPFKIGDCVEIEGTTGRIERVTFRSTRILDGQGRVVVFPNTQMLSKKLMNNSTHPLTAVKVNVSIGSGDSIDLARATLLKMIEGDRRICLHPAPTVDVIECTASSVQLSLSLWIQDESQEYALKVQYLERAKKALDASAASAVAAPTREIRAAA